MPRVCGYIDWEIMLSVFIMCRLVRFLLFVEGLAATFTLSFSYFNSGVYCDP